jgi:hypothetical protein
MSVPETMLLLAPLIRSTAGSLTAAVVAFDGDGYTELRALTELPEAASTELDEGHPLRATAITVWHSQGVPATGCDQHASAMIARIGTGDVPAAYLSSVHPSMFWATVEHLRAAESINSARTWIDSLGTVVRWRVHLPGLVELTTPWLDTAWLRSGASSLLAES